MRYRRARFQSLIAIWCLLSLPVGAADTAGTMAWLRPGREIDVPAIKQTHLASTLRALLGSCTVATVVDDIPPVSYKGVRLVDADGKLLEAHIVPNSRDSLMVRLYTRERGVVRLHAKYTEHAYALIGMLELEP